MAVFFGKAQLTPFGKSTGGSWTTHSQNVDPMGKSMTLSNKTNAWLVTGEFKEIVALVSQVTSFDYKDGGSTNIAISAWKPGDVQGAAEIMSKNLLKLVPIPLGEMADLANFLIRCGVKALTTAARKERLLRSLNFTAKDEWAVAIYHASPNECSKLYSNVDIYWPRHRSVSGPDMASVLLQWKAKQGGFHGMKVFSKEIGNELYSGVVQKAKKALRGGEKNYQANGDELFNYGVKQ